MKSLYFHKLSLRTISVLSLFLFLAALVFSDLAKTSPIFRTTGVFTVVLDPGHGGCSLRGWAAPSGLWLQPGAARIFPARVNEAARPA